MLNPPGPHRMRPAPDLSLVEDPSTYRSHFSWSGLSGWGLSCLPWGTGASSGNVHSTMKSMSAWALIDVHGRNTKLNWLSSTAQLMRHPEASGLWMIFLRG